MGTLEMRLVASLFVACWVSGSAARANPFTENFDKFKAGQSLSSEWQGGFYGPKGDPVWKIETDKEAPSSPNVLKQSGNAVYNWIVRQGKSRENGFVEAKFRVASGKEDPEAGVIWRFIDGKNYYYVRANAIENNIIVYKMAVGKKVSLKSVDLSVGNAWHTIHVGFNDSSIAVNFDGKDVLSLQDSTIIKPGRVGFFTTADTVALFDDFLADETK
jgi:hypothetical protein